MRGTIVVFVSIVSLALSTTALEAAPADDQYFAAANDYSQGKWAPAREAFEKFLAAHPMHPQSDQARFYLGETLVQLQDYTAAADHFQSLIARRMGDSLGRKVLYRAGESAYFAKLYDRAQEQLKRFANEYPGDKLNAYVLSYLGSIALEKGELDKAFQFYTEGLERFPQGALSGDCHLGLGRILERQGKVAEAREVYTRAIAKNDNWSDAAQLRLAESYRQAKDHAQAVAAFESLVTRFPTSKLLDEARLNLAQSQLALNKPADAERSLAAIPDSSSFIAEARYWRGKALLQLNKPADAAKSFQAVMQANPKHAQLGEMAVVIAEQLQAAGKLDEARQWFDRAANAGVTGDSGAKTLLGQIESSAAAGDQAQVIQAARRFLQQFTDHPRRITAELHLARDHLAANQVDETLKLLEPALARPVAAKNDDPAVQHDRLTCHYLLALAYQTQNRGDDVLKTLQPLLDSNESKLAELRQQALRLQAAVLVSQNKFAAAVSVLEQYLKQPGEDGEHAARAQLAICHARLKQVAPTKSALAAFLASKPNDELRKATLTALAEAAQSIDDETIANDLSAELAKHGITVDSNLAAYNAARTAEKAGKFEQAASAYQKLVATPPPGVTVDLLWYNAAWAWKQAGKPEQSRAAFETLHREHVESRYWSDATYRLAESAVEAKQFEQARTWIAALVQREKEGDVLLHALYLQGQLAIQAEQWSDATTALERIVKQYPQHTLRPLAEFWLGEVAYRQRQFEVAQQRFDALVPQLKTAPQPTWAAMVPLRRAQIRVQLKQYAEAREIAEQIGRDFPQFEQQYEVDYVLGRTHAMAAEFDEAREAYQRVIRSPRGSRTETAAMAQWMLAETYFHQRNFAEALKEYQRVETVYVSFAQWQALALLQAGKCCEQLGQWTQASETYARLIKNHPQSSQSAEASSRLQAAREQQSRK